MVVPFEVRTQHYHRRVVDVVRRASALQLLRQVRRHDLTQSQRIDALEGHVVLAVQDHLRTVARLVQGRWVVVLQLQVVRGTVGNQLRLRL